MTIVSLDKDFNKRNGKYEVRYNKYDDIGIYTVSSEYYNVNYKEDLKISVIMQTEEGIVNELDVNVINVERMSKRRELIAFKVKEMVNRHIENIKRIHDNILDVNFIKDVVSYIMNYSINRYKVVTKEEVVKDDTTSLTTTDKVDVVVTDKVEAKETVEVVTKEDDTTSLTTTDKVDVVVKDDTKSLTTTDKVCFNRNFEITVNGLLKSYSLSTEEVETSYGYKDFVCKMEAKSTILIDGEYALIKAYVEVYDGVVTYMNICRDNNHLQLESFLDSMNDNRISRKVDTLIDNIKYEVNSYIYEKDINFAYSILTMILNINSFDTNTYLINDTTYNLVDVA